MRNFLAVSSGAALLAFAGACSAQPTPPARISLQSITMEMVNTVLPDSEAVAPDTGPYAVTTEPTFSAPGFLLFRPTDLDAFPARDTLPVIVWGNGGCALDSNRYSGFLTTLASHGFVVVGTAPRPAPPAGGARPSATAEDLRAALDWVEQENKRVGSPLNGKVAVDKIAVMGQSCGGMLSMVLGADARVDTIGVFNSGVLGIDPNAAPSGFPDASIVPAIHGPVLLINGAERDFMTAPSKYVFELLDKPAFYGERHGGGHTASAFHPGGGEYANVAAAWAMWQLKGDQKASAMFVGKDCTLCTNPNWTTAAKKLTN